MNKAYDYVQEYRRTQYEETTLQFTKKHQVTAKYIRSFDSSDNGNRLIEALPPLRSEEECANDFTQIPCWSPEHRKKSVRERQSLCSHLSEFKIPRDFTLDVDFRIYNMLISCYRARIPVECPGSTCPGFYEPKGEAIPGGLLIGHSGAGKTTAVHHALRYYPQLIVHEMGDSRMLQIPYINVLCPPDASVKAFYDLCLYEIERITGNPIPERIQRSTKDTKAQVFRRQALRYNIGLVVIDEVQNIMNAQKKTLMQHFLNLSNELSVPFMFVGTEKVRDFFSREEFYIKRRTGALINANVFDKDDIWNDFFQKLWKFQWTQEAIPYSQEFGNVFFEESAGNIDRVKELYLVAQQEAIKGGFDTVQNFTPDYIRSVSRRHFEISYEELNKKAKNPQPIMPILFDSKSFHEQEEHKMLLTQSAGKKEEEGLLKYRVVENVGRLAKDKFRLQEIEKAFETVSEKINVLKTEEFSVSMEVLNVLLEQSSKKATKVIKRTKEPHPEVLDFSMNLPMFEGFGAEA